MNLSPVSARLPARKHLLAGAVAFFSVALMVVAVLGTAGLPTPFSAGGANGIRISPVEGVLPVDTTTTVADLEAQGAGVTSDAPSPTTPSTGGTTATLTTVAPGAPTTTTTTFVPAIPTTTVPDTPTEDLLGGLGLGRGMFGP